MSITMEREVNQPAKPARPAPLLLKRRVSAGEVEQRFSRGRSKPVAVEIRRRASPIRAWRGAETDLSQTPKQEDSAAAQVATAAAGHSFVREAGAGSRLSAVERAARVRAIEQAWKEERARQAELETEKQRGAEAAARQRAEEEARRQADELKRQTAAQREAEERARLALEQTKRFRAEAPAKVGDEKTKDAAGRDEARGPRQASEKSPCPAQRSNQPSRAQSRTASIVPSASMSEVSGTPRSSAGSGALRLWARRTMPPSRRVLRRDDRLGASAP